MLHPTRTNLLSLKEKRLSVNNSVRILKARRQALIKELLGTSRHFLRSRQQIRDLYRRAISELSASRSIEGEPVLASIVAVSRRNLQFGLSRRNLLGVPFHEVALPETLRRPLTDRPYDYWQTTVHLEEAIHLFERVAEAVLEIAVHESKLKRIGEEIGRVSRRTRVLEDRLLPRLGREIRTISQYLAERDRESHFRLKRFKELHVETTL